MYLTCTLQPLLFYQYLCQNYEQNVNAETVKEWLPTLTEELMVLAVNQIKGVKNVGIKKTCQLTVIFF